MHFFVTSSSLLLVLLLVLVLLRLLPSSSSPSSASSVLLLLLVLLLPLPFQACSVLKSTALLAVSTGADRASFSWTELGRPAGSCGSSGNVLASATCFLLRIFRVARFFVVFVVVLLCWSVWVNKL